MIQVGAQNVFDVGMCDERSFAGECTYFKIRRKPMVSFDHDML